MADFERGRSEIGLEFVHCSFAEHNNFSEGSSETKKDAQVIQVQGAAAPILFSFELPVCNARYIYIYIPGPAIDQRVPALLCVWMQPVELCEVWHARTRP